MHSSSTHTGQALEPVRHTHSILSPTSNSRFLDDAPTELHVPCFTYPASADDLCRSPPDYQDESVSNPFHFSALFQSTLSASPGLSVLRSTPRPASGPGSPLAEASFIGFSWGPPRDAFPPSDGAQRAPDVVETPRPLLSVQPSSFLAHGWSEVTSGHPGAFATPIRPQHAAGHHSLPRTNTTGRTPMRRAVSDREAMRQLVDCIGMSARKKVLASGRKPRILGSINRTMAVNKELRFGPPPTVTNASGASTDFPPVCVAPESEATESGSEGPPSPSPSPRPGSALSMLSRRSTTPTVTVASHSSRFLSLPSSSLSEVIRSDEHRDEGSDDDEAFSLLEKRHTALVSQLCDIQTQIDCLRELGWSH